jgi:hypothetical protein
MALLSRSLPVLPPASAARERLLPAHPVLVDLLPQAALQRGTVVQCAGAVAESLALLVASAASYEGAWTAVAGGDSLGLRAVDELGISLERLVIVRDAPAGFSEQQWGEILAVMIDGFDLVLVGRRAVDRIRPAMARRLQARGQSRGAVMVIIGDTGTFSADIEVRAEAGNWSGLGQGHGCARAREVQITVTGRRVPRPHHVAVWLPSDLGDCELSVVFPILPAIAQPTEQPPGDVASAMRQAG